jgi:hypothetical protein
MRWVGDAKFSKHGITHASPRDPPLMGGVQRLLHRATRCSGKVLADPPSCPLEPLTEGSSGSGAFGSFSFIGGAFVSSRCRGVSFIGSRRGRLDDRLLAAMS